MKRELRWVGLGTLCPVGPELAWIEAGGDYLPKTPELMGPNSSFLSER